MLGKTQASIGHILVELHPFNALQPKTTLAWKQEYLFSNHIGGNKDPLNSATFRRNGCLEVDDMEPSIEGAIHMESSIEWAIDMRSPCC